jgi:hypothetical protein
MKTKSLFVVTALIEAGTGLTLVVAPLAAAALVFGTRIETTTGTALAALAGSALIALATDCWLARNEGEGRGTRSLLAAMLVYNIAAVAVLARAGLVSGLRGPVLWPAVVLHTALALWCIICLRASQVK